ncbi:conserved hypothetical protein [Histoplasma capsulatum var. duboisii H88]|uniref:Uncharacterized protein n=1 Tax=Ajellomyces capsulatus (strain H88) TaxID=544711 RepID=F0UB93_AJEC8|nr:conserved hypothetical protein [Histoplasma capsulatum var. duboisii H88]
MSEKVPEEGARKRYISNVKYEYNVLITEKNEGITSQHNWHCLTRLKKRNRTRENNSVKKARPHQEIRVDIRSIASLNTKRAVVNC